jgi:hypothetical protein
MRIRPQPQPRSILLLVLAAALHPSAWAQQPNPDSNQQLLQRIEELEKQVQSLRAQVSAAPVAGTLASASVAATPAALVAPAAPQSALPSFNHGISLVQ